ncbi:hypothetical protein Slala02_78300 [Streptomyces lavendulae subsp. lavendulae]|nr:hypothetical protein Slala01_78040 [Streptomyces lavendulae subsp. lavendulae]GLX32011.1 hypothetical protein Slala02_78300 [Streptomyces lavendulae subsp. lavendulae]
MLVVLLGRAARTEGAPVYASWANPIEVPHTYRRWRNKNAHHPEARLTAADICRRHLAAAS